MLRAHGEPVDMDWDGHHDLGATGTAIPTQAMRGETSLDPFPLGSSVLEPDFHLFLRGFIIKGFTFLIFK